MKKVINDVWTVKLPNGDIHIDASVSEATVRDFAKGRGRWGDRALVARETVTTTVFENIQEAKDYVEYTKIMDDNLKTILDNSDVSRISGIVHFMNNYVSGTLAPEQYTVIPDIASGELLVQMAELFEPEFGEKNDEEQADMLAKMKDLYDVVRNQTVD